MLSQVPRCEIKCARLTANNKRNWWKWPSWSWLVHYVKSLSGVLFSRRCLLTVYRAWSIRKQMGMTGDVSLSIHSMAAQQLRSLNSELGINLHGDPSPEVILRELDPQSMILCGLSPATRTYQRPSVSNMSNIQSCIVRLQSRGSDHNSSSEFNSRCNLGGDFQDQASRDLKKFGYSLSDCSSKAAGTFPSTWLWNCVVLYVLFSVIGLVYGGKSRSKEGFPGFSLRLD